MHKLAAIFLITESRHQQERTVKAKREQQKVTANRKQKPLKIIQIKMLQLDN